MSALPQLSNPAKPDSAGRQAEQLYAEAVNPHWPRLLMLLQMNVHYERCIGAELFTGEGRRIFEVMAAIYQVVKLAHSLTIFWSEALGLARRAVNV